MTPYQRQQGTDGDGAIGQLRHHIGGNMDEQQSYCGALLVVRRHAETEIQAQRKTECSGDGRERQHRPRQAHELVRIGIAEQELHLTTPNLQLDKLRRTLAAAAKGLSSTAAKAKAASRPRAFSAGKLSRARDTAPAPKITAGASSGSTIRGRINPPRFRDRVRLAPMAPTALTAGVPTRSETNRIAVAGPGRLNSSASSGDSRTKGRPVDSQWAAILASATNSSGKGDSAITSRLPSSKSPWNNRSRDRSAASTAATHRIPPATRANSFRSAPTPKR